MNYSLLDDNKNSDALIINEYIPNIKLFEYFDRMKIFIGYINTSFSLNNDYINKIPYNFTKYYLFNNYSLIECNDFIDIILKKIKILNKNY